MQKSEDLFDEEYKKEEIIERIIKKAIDKVKNDFKNIEIEYEFNHSNVDLKINSFKENDFIKMYYQLLRFAILKEWDSFILK